MRTNSESERPSEPSDALPGLEDEQLSGPDCCGCICDNCADHHNALGGQHSDACIDNFNENVWILEDET